MESRVNKDTRPMRRCLGCNKSFSQDSLIRMTLIDNRIIIDRDCKNDGRGFYLCKCEECISLAFKKKAFNRACKCQLDLKMLDELHSDLITELVGGNECQRR
ncbi:MAG: YlxR family protein [Clostridiales bacterium]|jgi:predicted RNA-binding protein YlxR (DUF448 family)|nr:YlxR family protein [Clostridiales bacterium]